MPAGPLLITTPLPSGAASGTQSIEIGANGRLTLSSCAATHVLVRGTRRSTHVRADLICASHRRLDFHAEIDVPECTLHARVKATRRRASS